ncbi:PepSY domain-containing protein [Shewanella inventionis]|uniref:Peptidase M4 n=1 Tax=Shewanella inventionis TaxID=1738770 RepID=A0ABQ1IT51_9GAMM|nr:PepSY domain-containing protein [Shewanella inventionis]MCL1156680.1 PepSY domain-containing protein [Shewanella inventionis]UAL44893.1 PepSY domain-containing protein [Shewanella inventionis]GGB50475.1 peptidase M4 [Shewanella inventionis]
MQRMLKLNAILLGLMLVISSHSVAGTSLVATSSIVAPFQLVPGPKDNRQSKNLVVSSAQQAIQIAKRSYSGKVLKVQSSSVNGNPGYRVKLLTNDGVIFYVSVDATNGSVSRN